MKGPTDMVLFSPECMLTVTVCLLRKFIQKFRLKGISGMCPVQCLSQSWDSFHVRAGCSGPCQSTSIISKDGDVTASLDSVSVLNHFGVKDLKSNRIFFWCDYWSSLHVLSLYLCEGFGSRTFLQVAEDNGCFTWFLHMPRTRGLWLSYWSSVNLPQFALTLMLGVGCNEWSS